MASDDEKKEGSNDVTVDQDGECHINAKVEAGHLRLAGSIMTVRVQQPMPEDHPFYRLVGRVASEWSHLEHSLDVLIWDMVGIERRLAACLTAQFLGIPARCNAINTLGRTLGVSDADLKPIRKLRADSSNVADWRARWVHDAWYSDKDTGAPAQFRAMPSADPRYGLQDISDEEINNTIGRIKDLQTQAWGATNGVRRALEALRGTRK